MDDTKLRAAIEACFSQDETITAKDANPDQRAAYLAEASDRADAVMALLERSRAGRPITRPHDLAELRVAYEIENRLLREEADSANRELERVTAQKHARLHAISTTGIVDHERMLGHGGQGPHAHFAPGEGRWSPSGNPTADAIASMYHPSREEERDLETAHLRARLAALESKGGA